MKTILIGLFIGAIATLYLLILGLLIISIIKVTIELRIVNKRIKELKRSMKK